MQTHLADWLKGSADGVLAESILRKCVHCGFCTATCPTYQLLGDELDGPRGRIYLIKQVLEGKEPTLSTMNHLDRCLTCRNCESTCPSGVEYGHLVDVGRKIVESKVQRRLPDRLLRIALREGMTTRWLFEPAMKMAKLLRPLLPEGLRKKVPKNVRAGAWPKRQHPRKVLLLNGCVQPSMMPSIDAATARVLDRLGVQAVVAARSSCCGAVRHHLNDHDGALVDARRNIDAWWPYIDPQASALSIASPNASPSALSSASPSVTSSRCEAILINASGCGAMVKDYGHLLRDDPAYAEKAKRVVELCVDLAQWLPQFTIQVKSRVMTRRSLDRAGKRVAKIAFHPPCTLQHGQQVRGEVEKLLTTLGVHITAIAESHLCCGSAGTYSVLQPELATQLRDQKLGHLNAGEPDQILSANIGCLTHLQSGSDKPVRHWIEWLDEAMAD